MKQRIALLTTGLIFIHTSPAAAQNATFQGLGDFNGGPFESLAAGISRDGTRIVGHGWIADTQVRAFIWDSLNGMVELLDVPPADAIDSNGGMDISDDGLVIVGWGNHWDADHNQSDSEAALWSEGNPQRLGFLGGDTIFRSSALAVTADGTIIVGYSTYKGGADKIQAFRWADNVMEPLGDLTGGALQSIAADIAADGSIIVGYGTNAQGKFEACTWQNGAIAPLGHLPGGTSGHSFAFAVSDDGTVIVGASDSANGRRACIWQNGAVVDLGVPQGATRTEAYAMSGDGSIIGGSADFTQAFIWDSENGLRDLKDALENDYGLDLTGWSLWRVEAISADGTVLVGRGQNPDGNIEAWRATLPRDVDSDGDGLLDSWETDGLDINDDGVIDLDLPALGCDPNFKDLFVEVDIMQNAPFSAQAMQVVIDAFANAPLINPNGQPGINLHIDWQNADTIPFKEFWSDNFSEDFDIEKQVYFGTQAQRDDPNWEHIKAAKKRVYRYCAVVNRFTPSRAMGWGERPGNDFAIALGGVSDLEMRVIASTFMHELGHNLNLQHGGADRINYKPNYVSTMNYNFDQIVYNDASGQHHPLTHFSNEILPPLDESSLDESVGLVSTEYANYWVYYGWRPPGEAPRIEWLQLNSAPYDWNHNGVIESSVVVDLNWHGPSDTPSPGQTMNDQNDWDNIILPLGTTGDYQDAHHETIDYTELSEDEFQWYRDNLPPVPANLATLNDLNVVFGEALEGELSDLVASDQQKLKLRSQPGFSAVEPDLIRLTVGAMTDVENPATLGLVFEGRLTHPNGQSRLLLKNWSTGQLVQQTQFTLGFTEEQKFVKDIPAADYVRADDGRIEVVVHQFVIAVFSALGFDSHIDRLEVSVTPE